MGTDRARGAGHAALVLADGGRLETRSRLVLAVVALALGALLVTVPLAATVASAVVVVALAPLGRSLTGRIGAVLLIWMAASQFAYTVAWPTSLPPRQAVAWTLAGLVVLGRRATVWPGLRLAVGRVGLPPLALAAFAGITTWWFWPWRGDATHVLDRMFLGWDNSGHFGMVEQLRAPQAAAADMFPGYPRGFHCLVASLMELGVGAPAGLDSELVAYSAAALIAAGGSLVLLVAFVFDSPVFRRSPVLLVPGLAALVTICLQLQDAAQVPYFGFGNFLEATAFACSGVLLVVRWGREEDSWRWFLFGCAAAGVVGTWPPLLAFLVPVPVAVWLARRRFQAGTLRRLVPRAVVAVVVVLLAVLGQPRMASAFSAATQSSTGPRVNPLVALDRFLLLDGAIGTSALAWPVVVPLAGIVVPLGLATYRRRSPAGLRIAYLWLPAAVAMVMAVTMLGYEAVRVGSPRYYGIKVLCAATLVAGSVAVVACTHVLEELLRRPRPPAVIGLATAALSVVLLFCAGGPVPLGPLPASPGGLMRTDIATDRPERREQLATAVLGACEAISGRPGEYYLLVPGATHDDLVRANSWIITCGLDWGTSDHSNALRQLLPDKAAEGPIVVDLPVDTRRILQSRPRAKVIVPSASVSSVGSGLSAAERQRLVTF